MAFVALLGAACGLLPAQSKYPGECDEGQLRRGVQSFIAAVNAGDRAGIRGALSDRFLFYAAQTTPSDGFTTAGPDLTIERLIELHGQGERMTLRRVGYNGFTRWSGDTGFEYDLDRQIGSRVVHQVGKGAVECNSGTARLVLWGMGFVTR